MIEANSVKQYQRKEFEDSCQEGCHDSIRLKTILIYHSTKWVDCDSDREFETAELTFNLDPNIVEYQLCNKKIA